MNKSPIDRFVNNSAKKYLKIGSNCSILHCFYNKSIRPKLGFVAIHNYKSVYEHIYVGNGKCSLSNRDKKAARKIGINFCKKEDISNDPNFHDIFELQVYLNHDNLTYKDIKGNDEIISKIQTKRLTHYLKYHLDEYIIK
jgi:hypothetical protein